MKTFYKLIAIITFLCFCAAIYLSYICINGMIAVPYSTQLFAACLVYIVFYLCGMSAVTVWAFTTHGERVGNNLDDEQKRLVRKALED